MNRIVGRLANLIAASADETPSFGSDWPDDPERAPQERHDNIVRDRQALDFTDSPTTPD